MIVRDYDPEDETKVKQMITSVLNSISKKRKIEWEDFSKYQFFYVVEDNEEIVGTCALKKVDKNLIKLKRMYVALKYQRKGIGKQLLEKAITFAKENKFKKVILTTYPEMKDAVEFYKKNGFIIRDNPPDEFFTNPILRKYNKEQIAMELKL